MICPPSSSCTNPVHVRIFELPGLLISGDGCLAFTFLRRHERYIKRINPNVLELLVQSPLIVLRSQTLRDCDLKRLELLDYNLFGDHDRLDQ